MVSYHLSILQFLTEPALLENCPVPARMSGYSVAGNIRKAAGKLGDEISSFKAYVDIQRESQAKTICQVELQASGVTFVHCPHNNRKEVADRVLLGESLISNPRQSS